MQGVDPAAKDVEGRTPLHHAVMRGHLQVVELLIQAGPPSVLLSKDVLPRQVSVVWHCVCSASCPWQSSKSMEGGDAFLCRGSLPTICPTICKPPGLAIIVKMLDAYPDPVALDSRLPDGPNLDPIRTLRTVSQGTSH